MTHKAHRWYWRSLLILLVFCVLWQWLGAIWIYAKAHLAHYWIAQSWQEQLAQGQGDGIKPWPWADTWPVARLQWLDAQGEVIRDLYVLAGAHGSAMAFGPGHLEGTDLPGQGASVIGGHRDTHFAFLREVSTGDALRVQSAEGQWTYYRVMDTAVADSAREPLAIQPDISGLWLVTCYPFDALQAGGSLRYVVFAQGIVF